MAKVCKLDNIPFVVIKLITDTEEDDELKGFTKYNKLLNAASWYTNILNKLTI